MEYLINLLYIKHGRILCHAKEDYIIDETNSMQSLLKLKNNRIKQLIMIKKDIDSFLENKISNQRELR